MQFTTNIGSIDRILRIVAGIALIAMAVAGIFSPWGWVGAILLATAFMKFCPIYKILGLKSCTDC